MHPFYAQPFYVVELFLFSKINVSALNKQTGLRQINDQYFGLL
ncbi:hypothetical protein J500_2593 [Acinetobacter sp. 479375]|nr:hypothetical protein J500_2593 [Acinetobacter sp. 479375]